MRQRSGLRMLMVVATIALMLVSSVSIYAQRGRGQRAQMDGMGQGVQAQSMRQDMSCVMNLTPEQAEQIKEYKLAQIESTAPIRNRMDELRAQLRTQRSVDPANLEAINITIDELTEFKNTLMKMNAAHRASVSEVLTDEQRVIFNSRANRGQRSAGMNSRGQRNGQRSGRGQGQGQGFGQGTPCYGYGMRWN